MLRCSFCAFLILLLLYRIQSNRILFKLAKPYGLVSLMLGKARLNDCGPHRATLILMMVPFTNGNAGRFSSRPSTSTTGLSEPGGKGWSRGHVPLVPLCVKMGFTRTSPVNQDTTTVKSKSELILIKFQYFFKTMTSPRFWQPQEYIKSSKDLLFLFVPLHFQTFRRPCTDNNFPCNIQKNPLLFLHAEQAGRNKERKTNLNAT